MHWETVGLLIDHGVLLLALQCNAWDSCLHSKGLNRSYFDPPGDYPECSVLAWFHLVQSGWGQARFPGWYTVIDYAGVKGPIDLVQLVFPPAPGK